MIPLTSYSIALPAYRAEKPTFEVTTQPIQTYDAKKSLVEVSQTELPSQPAPAAVAAPQMPPAQPQPQQPQIVYVQMPAGQMPGAMAPAPAMMAPTGALPMTSPLNMLNQTPVNVQCRSCGQRAVTRTTPVIGGMNQYVLYP